MIVLCLSIIVVALVCFVIFLKRENSKCYVHYNESLKEIRIAKECVISLRHDISRSDVNLKNAMFDLTGYESAKEKIKMFEGKAYDAFKANGYLGGSLGVSGMVQDGSFCQVCWVRDNMKLGIKSEFKQEEKE